MSSDSSLSIHQYGSSTRSTSSDSCLSIFVSQAPLQDPCLRIQVSATICISGTSSRSASPDPYISIHMYLRILYKAHVFGFMSQHPLIWILYKIHIFGFMSQHLCISGSSADPCLRIHVSASICISGSSARSMSPIHVSASLYLRVLCKIHVSGFMTQHLYISGSSARSTSPGSCLSVQEPLQDPCLRAHVSASLYLRILYKAHVFGFMSEHSLIWILYKIHIFGLMSQHLCISGSSARPMSPDTCISIHMYLRILCKIHVSDSCLSIFISQGPLQDPCLWLHVSASLYLRILCKIHVSGSIYQHAYVSQDPLKIHVSDSSLSTYHYLRILCKIHAAGSIAQPPCVSGSSQDPRLWIHVSVSLYLTDSLLFFLRVSEREVQTENKRKCCTGS